MLVWLGGNAQPNAFLDVFNTPAYSGTSIGYKVVDLDTGETLVENNPDQVLVPASIQKLITTATALNVLGENHTYQTKLYYKGEIVDSVLNGDLYIIGGGDPTFNSRYFYRENPFDLWKDKLKEKGVSHIVGNIYYDDSYYSKDQIPDTWVWGDIGNYYGTGVSGLNYSDNTVFVEFQSKEVDSLTEIKSITPTYADLIYDNRVVAANIRSDQAYIFGAPEMNNRYITGRIPSNRKSFKVKGSVPNPGSFMAESWANFLIQDSILENTSVQNEYITIDSSFTLVDRYNSPPLSGIVFKINQHSINLFAEGILRELAKKKTLNNDFASGSSYIKQYWANKGIYTQNLFIKDGSGLSRFNGVSASTMIDVLKSMKDSKAFYNSLPVAGVSGTLKNMLKGSFAENNLRAKSGSMERVRSYAGYATTKSGKKIAFTVILNNYTNSSYQVKKDLELFMKKITEL